MMTLEQGYVRDIAYTTRAEAVLVEGCAVVVIANCVGSNDGVCTIDTLATVEAAGSWELVLICWDRCFED